MGKKIIFSSVFIAFLLLCSKPVALSSLTICALSERPSRVRAIYPLSLFPFRTMLRIGISTRMRRICSLQRGSMIAFAISIRMALARICC